MDDRRQICTWYMLLEAMGRVREGMVVWVEGNGVVRWSSEAGVSFDDLHSSVV